MLSHRVPYRYMFITVHVYNQHSAVSFLLSPFTIPPNWDVFVVTTRS